MVFNKELIKQNVVAQSYPATILEMVHSYFILLPNGSIFVPMYEP